jgi:aminocarboxymuconate-semialdehyde decarboxylase
MPTYDVHAHVIVREALDEMRASHPDSAPTLHEADGAFWLTYPGRRARLGPIPAGMFDVQLRLADMDRQRVDVQLLSVAPPNYHYHVAADVGNAFAQIQNDAMVRMAEKQPDRFAVFATLPLQDPDMALAEVARMAAHGRIRGVQIGTNVNKRNLDDAALEPVWAALADADLPVWVHPDQRGIAGEERLSQYYLANLIGNPLESTIAMGSLIFGGVLERHPALRFGFVHGGGFTPYQIGRWDHGWGCRPEPKTVVADVPPSQYFGRFFFDSLTHDALSLELLGRRVGWDHVVVGSDYPFDMGPADPVGGVEQVDLTAEQRRAVLEGNAERFLRPVPDGL